MGSALQRLLDLRSTTVFLFTLAYGSTANAEGDSVAIHGLVYYENYSYFRHSPGADINSRNELLFRPRLEFSPSEKLDGAASVEVREDVSDSSRSKIYLYEGYLNVYFPQWSLKVGRQFITWGRADTVKPTDVFARRDYTDIVERRQEATLALRADVNVGFGTIELVWAPVLEPDILPLMPNSRWYLLDRTANWPAAGGDVRMDYQFNARAEPIDGLRASRFGIRFSGNSGRWDYALMYAPRIYDRIPTYFDVGVALPSPTNDSLTVAMTPHYRPLHVVGLDVGTVVGEFGLRAEAAYTLTSNPQGADPRVDTNYLQVVGGIDYTLHVSDASEIFALVEYALDTNVFQRGISNQESPQELVRMRHYYRQAAICNVEYRISEFVKPIIKGMVDLEEGQFLLQPELYWGVMDGLSLVTGADILGGPRDTLLGRFRENSRARARLEGRF